MSHAGGGVITSANSSIQDHRDEAVSNMAPLCQLDMAGVTWGKNYINTVRLQCVLTFTSH